MSDTREFGSIFHVSAEAIGQPGQRRFRLRIMSDASESASLWLEKEQLNSLGDAIETVLADENYHYSVPPLDDFEAEPVFPLTASVEMHIGQLSMGVNRDTRRIVLIATDRPDADEPEGSTISFEFDYRRGYELRQQVINVVAAGRPPCPLCTAPMAPEGHVCVRSNGHNPH